MNILVVGAAEEVEFIVRKISSEHTIRRVSNGNSLSMDSIDVVFDFTLKGSPDELISYADQKDLFVFVNSVLFSLSGLTYGNKGIICKLFGYNGQPTFIDRDILEVTCLKTEDKEDMDKILQSLTIDYKLVEDRVGMVTPRIIAMIINEAYYTVLEEVATKEDIDIGMKLGTNYPMGPFEWVEKWGITNIYDVLQALYKDTKNERYKCCPLLKKEYHNEGL